MSLAHDAASKPEAFLPAPIRRIAVNSASESENKIHDDTVAQRMGYRGALVPGVTLYAYLTQLAVAHFGADWLARGGATVRLLRPVYEGEAVICSAASGTRDGSPALTLTCAREDGTTGADSSAWLPSTGATTLLDVMLELPSITPADPRPPLTSERVPLGQPLAPLETYFSAEDARAYADETADPSPWYRGPSPLGGPLLPPGILAGRQARLLRHNFAYGPSIHTASEIAHLTAAPADALYRTGGVICETFERNGHHYLVLDAVSTANGVPVVRIRHTSIFQLRGS